MFDDDQKNGDHIAGQSFSVSARDVQVEKSGRNNHHDFTFSYPTQVYESENLWENRISPDYFFHHAPVGCLILNDKHQVVLANEKLLQILQTTEKTLLYKKFTSYLPSHTISEYISAYKNLHDPNSNFSLRLHIIRENGSEFEATFHCSYYSGDALKPNFLGVITDISESKGKELLIEKKFELLTLAGQLIRLGVWEFDTVSRDFLYSSEAGKLLGFPINDELNLHIIKNDQNIPFHAGFIQILNNVLGSGKAVDEELLLNSQSAPQKWARILAIPVRKSGTICSLRGIITDITKEKSHQEEKASELAELRSVNEVKAKFFSVIAHDIRGPFHGLLMVTEYLLNQQSKLNSAELADMHNHLHDSIQKQYHLLTDLLAWLRLQGSTFTVSLTRLNLSTLVQNVIEQQSITARQKSIQLINAVPKDFSLNADENMLGLVFRNLISNGIKFSSSGGTVSIRSIMHENLCKIFITDSGTGIPEDEIPHLFLLEAKKSKEGTNHETGTGYGLLLCKEVIDKHNGQIDVDSIEGEGTTFIISLPQTNDGANH
ncbi:MAG: PAS domain-containing sensor histidine kinase [Ignavibacteria bacterium]|nr:PAS domain-containing sensor histidine kinase [Ignavibacteria bacterium]